MSHGFETKMSTIFPDGRIKPNMTFMNPDREGVNKLLEMFVGIYVGKDNGVLRVNEPNRVEIELSDARIVFDVTPPQSST